jgi:S1-C subfamily serine protease
MVNSKGRPLLYTAMRFCKRGNPIISFCAVLLAMPLARIEAAEPDIRRDATVASVERALPSVVNIATETVREYHDWYDTMLRQFYGWPRQQKSISLGSGVIIDDEGYVLTNFHVVHRASRIQVKLWDGREYDADPVVETEGSDVALVKIRSKPGETFKAIKLAPDDDLLLGETVLAMGNPYGLGGSVTRGILSSKNRRPTTGNEPLRMEDWLQTDAAINPGNSGGPLVNLRGELIGLNVAVYREEQGGERGVGVGFSVPVKQVSAALSRFFTPEVLDGLWFGAQFKPGNGPLVATAVQPGSPAAKADLREGDQVVRVNDQAPAGFLALNRLLTAPTNHQSKLELVRAGERRNVTVQLLPFEQVIRAKLGLTFLEPQTTERAGARPAEGLYIDEVENGGPAERAALRHGYLVSALDGHSVTSLFDVVQVLTGKKNGERVKLTVVARSRLSPSYVELRQGNVDVTLR